MKTSEMVFNYLRSQGFSPQFKDDGSIWFKYQMASFIYPNNDNDSGYFQLLFPAIYELPFAKRAQAFDVVNEQNLELKVAKTFVVGGDSVWMSFEILLDTTPDIADIMPRALQILMGGRETLYKKMQNL